MGRADSGTSYKDECDVMSLFEHHKSNTLLTSREGQIKVKMASPEVFLVLQYVAKGVALIHILLHVVAFLFSLQQEV